MAVECEERNRHQNRNHKLDATNRRELRLLSLWRIACLHAGQSRLHTSGATPGNYSMRKAAIASKTRWLNRA